MSGQEAGLLRLPALALGVKGKKALSRLGERGMQEGCVPSFQRSLPSGPNALKAKAACWKTSGIALAVVMRCVRRYVASSGSTPVTSDGGSESRERSALRAR